MCAPKFNIATALLKPIGYSAEKYPCAKRIRGTHLQNRYLFIKLDTTNYFKVIVALVSPFYNFTQFTTFAMPVGSASI